MSSLYVKDEEANALADRLARRRGISKTAAVKLALQHELDRDTVLLPLRERLRLWRDEHPLGEPTGLKADKAFYDSLNDEDDD
ncbi:MULTISPECIES: type II toxin-antitoxin system VapB family antitoxin [unclassified Sphingomonas]|jgi:antitoxin VapB|uniref:type II toxin-antitoxin system VapB family antitoxin n=1 Tax=unclassified Sphingomonas TaxID=196159 RepID=UPI000E102162|nr:MULTISPECIES: type II toxin-antitoxin system VapB family antitoxin [unclassified Sphingomonas]AXJ95926.1 transcription factor [Sphingomonas sp. FARSPH]